MKRLATLLLIMVAACSGTDDNNLPAGDAIIFAVGSDYVGSSVASQVFLPALTVNQNAVAGVASTDPALRAFDGEVVIVNRFGFDNITVLYRDTLTLKGQYSTGAGSNPTDVAKIGQRYFVSTRAGKGLVVLDGDSLTEVDLGALDADDGSPNCHSVLAMDSYVLVSCGILDDGDDFLTPWGPGKVALVDTATLSIVDTAILTNQGPLNFMTVKELGGTFSEALVATVPNYGDLTQGCVERLRIDLAARSVTAEGCAYQNDDLGGYAAAMVVAGDTLWAAVVEGFDETDFGALGKVISLGLDNVVATRTGTDVRAFNLALCPQGQVAVADAAGGLRVFDDAMTELTTELLDIGAPPVEAGLLCY